MKEKMLHSFLLILALMQIKINYSFDISFFNYNAGSPGAFNENLLNFLHKTFNIDVFIESGTAYGTTTEKASYVFKHVHSIELFEPLYLKARDKFKNCANVSLHYGDSPALLSAILPEVKGKICFFLDGHYSGGETGYSDNYGTTPIIEELLAIKKSKINDAVIMIDDIRLFQKALSYHLATSGYPTLKEVYACIKEINPDYDFIVFGDVAIAFINESRYTVSPFLRAYTSIRLLQESFAPNDPLVGMLHALRNGSEKELLIFKDFARAYYNMGCHSAHFYLINGILALHKHQQEEAQLLLKNAAIFIPYVSKLTLDIP